jgi:hypothetical protein
MVSLLEFLQTKLEIIPGQTRNVNIDGFTFENLPVYGRGAIPLKVLWSYYKDMQGTQVLGKHTSIEIIKALTKRGECQTGLSSYFVRLRHASTVFKNMMRRLQSIDEIAWLPGYHFTDNLLGARTNEDYWTIKDNCDSLVSEWDDIKRFLTYEYSEKHLTIDGSCKAHCCKFGLSKDELCGQLHEDGRCTKCVGVLNFFCKIDILIDHVRDVLIDHELTHFGGKPS